METIQRQEKGLGFFTYSYSNVPRDLGDTSRHVERSARQDLPQHCKDSLPKIQNK